MDQLLDTMMGRYNFGRPTNTGVMRPGQSPFEGMQGIPYGGPSFGAGDDGGQMPLTRGFSPAPFTGAPPDAGSPSQLGAPAPFSQLGRPAPFSPQGGRDYLPAPQMGSSGSPSLLTPPQFGSTGTPATPPSTPQVGSPGTPKTFAPPQLGHPGRNPFSS
jgi:hypothetical protein